MPRRKRRDFTYKPYDPNFHIPDMIDRMANGELNVEVAACWNISIDTFYRWRRENPEFDEAYQKGLTFYEAWFIKNTLKPMIQGKLEGRHAFNSAIALANNKLNWQRGNPGGTVNNTQININQTNISNKTNQELTELIQKGIGYLEDMNVLDTKVVETSFQEVPLLENKHESDE